MCDWGARGDGEKALKLEIICNWYLFGNLQALRSTARIRGQFVIRPVSFSHKYGQVVKTNVQIRRLQQILTRDFERIHWDLYRIHRRAAFPSFASRLFAAPAECGRLKCGENCFNNCNAWPPCSEEFRAMHDTSKSTWQMLCRKLRMITAGIFVFLKPINYIRTAVCIIRIFAFCFFSIFIKKYDVSL